MESSISKQTSLSFISWATFQGKWIKGIRFRDHIGLKSVTNDDVKVMYLRTPRCLQIYNPSQLNHKRTLGLYTWCRYEGPQEIRRSQNHKCFIKAECTICASTTLTCITQSRLSNAYYTAYKLVTTRCYAQAKSDHVHVTTTAD